MAAEDSKSVSILNSIFWGNNGKSISGMSVTETAVEFCNVEGGFTGEGNIEGNIIRNRSVREGMAHLIDDRRITDNVQLGGIRKESHRERMF